MDVCSDKPEKESLSQNCTSVFMVILVAIVYCVLFYYSKKNDKLVNF